jgi:hypothetical protein
MNRRHHDQDIEQVVVYHSSTLVRIHRLQLHRYYLIRRVDRLTMEGTECIFLTLHSILSHTHIYTLIPLAPFNVDRVTDINKRLAVTYVGRDSANIMRVAFSIN